MSDISEWSIIVVDDEPDTRALFVPVLEHHNIQVYTAGDAYEALEMMATIHPTLAIIDLALPEINGWELLRKIKSDPATADIPAVAMTAYHSNSVAKDALDAGFAAYFPKPINLRNLVVELQSIIN